MKFKKLTAAAMAAAMLAAAVPSAVAVNSALSVTASAEETEKMVEGDWEYLINNNGETVTISKYNGTDTKVTIPATLNGKSVTVIGANTFNGVNFLKNVTIPNGVTRIGMNAFAGCASLENVTIPEGVNTIGYCAFSGCKSLESVTIPESVTEIKEVAFASCTSLKSATIPNGITVISDCCFQNCSSLETVTLSKSITAIYMDAFNGCTSLKNVIFKGTKEDWKTINIVEINNENLTNAEITFEAHTESAPESSVAPGGSEKAQEILDATLKSVDSKNGIEGEKLDELLFGKSGWTWGQVEKIEFSSEELFSVQYKNDKGDLVKLGDEAAARAAADGIWNTAWTLNTSEMAKDNKYAKVIAKDGTADITVKVYIKKGAEKPSGGTDQKPTGIALAIAPVVLAAGAVIVISKKRK